MTSSGPESTVPARLAEAEAAQRFWDLYFRNRFVELYRDDRQVWGRYALDTSGAKLLMGAQNHGQCRVERTTLAQYDYEGDGRFSEIGHAPVTVEESTARIIDRSYPYRSPPPFGSRRMSELVATTVRLCRWPSDGADLDALHRATASLRDDLPDTSQHLEAVLWLLGERQERASSGPIAGLLQDSDTLPPGHKRRLSHSATNTALEALSKINDKSRVEPLLALMERAEHSGRLRYAALFKRMFSTTRLLGLEALGESYFTPAFWRSVWAPHAGNSDSEWDQYDTGSLFWELRFLACQRLVRGDEALLSLCDDEVALIATRARSKYIPEPTLP